MTHRSSSPDKENWLLQTGPRRQWVIGAFHVHTQALSSLHRIRQNPEWNFLCLYSSAAWPSVSEIAMKHQKLSETKLYVFFFISGRIPQTIFFHEVLSEFPRTCTWDSGLPSMLSSGRTFHPGFLGFLSNFNTDFKNARDLSKILPAFVVLINPCCYFIRHLIWISRWNQQHRHWQWRHSGSVAVSRCFTSSHWVSFPGFITSRHQRDPGGGKHKMDL